MPFNPLCGESRKSLEIFFTEAIIRLEETSRGGTLASAPLEKNDGVQTQTLIVERNGN